MAAPAKQAPREAHKAPPPPVTPEICALVAEELSERGGDAHRVGLAILATLPVPMIEKAEPEVVADICYAAARLVGAEDPYEAITADMARLPRLAEMLRRGRFGSVQAVYKSWYGVNAARRMLRATAGAGGVSARDALAREARYHAQHVAAEAAREGAYRQLRGGAEAWGPILSWRAILDERTTPDCRWAHGKNFSATNPPAIGIPGANLLHAGCRCTVGPPLPGAPDISGAEPGGEAPA